MFGPLDFRYVEHIPYFIIQLYFSWKPAQMIVEYISTGVVETNPIHILEKS